MQPLNFTGQEQVNHWYQHSGLSSTFLRNTNSERCWKRNWDRLPSHSISLHYSAASSLVLRFSANSAIPILLSVLHFFSVVLLKTSLTTNAFFTPRGLTLSTQQTNSSSQNYFRPWDCNQCNGLSRQNFPTPPSPPSSHSLGNNNGAHQLRIRIIGPKDLQGISPSSTEAEIIGGIQTQQDRDSFVPIHVILWLWYESDQNYIWWI
jgi:hypothetical protein